MAGIESKKLAFFSVYWDPINKTLSRNVIIVREKYRNQGIGTQMNLATEEIGKRLDCTTVTIKIIAESSVQYLERKI